MSTITERLQFNGSKRLPVILQTEVSECGLASLAMIASYHGHAVDLNGLRQRFSTTLKGVTLHDITKMADQLHLNARPLKLDLNALTHLQLPAILHWDMNHFVVLKSIKRGKAIIHDPAVGERVYTYQQLSDHFTGVALELSPGFQFKKETAKRALNLSDMWKNISGIGKLLAQIFSVSLLLQILVVAGPIYLQMVVDDVVVSGDTDLLMILAIGFSMILLLNVLISSLREVIVLYLSTNLSLSMGHNLFQHLLKLPLDYFEKRHMGDIVSRFGSTTVIKDFLAKGAVTTVVDAIMALVTLTMMFIYSPLLSFVVIVSVILYLSMRLALYGSLKQRTEESVMAGAKADSNFMETVRGMQSIKLFGSENDRKNLWVNRFADLMNCEIRLGRFQIGYDAFNKAIFGIENIIIIYIAAYMVLGNQLTLGMMMAFISYKMQFTGKASNLVEQIIQYKMLSVHLDRISDIALTDPESHMQGDRGDQGIAHGSLELRNVEFRYSNIDPLLIERLNLTVSPGESIAIVGGSGCGKTTLMKVMLGLFQPSSGEVMVDGIDIINMGLQNYRSKIGVVMQDDQLLSGSIADNICFFDPKPNLDQIRLCAELAAINRDIEAMPMGYNSLVGDMGTTLSGGQKQRILLARALYRQPKILFLDEATSHLDTRLESVVNSNLKQYNITTIMVAHRPDTIRFADKVYRLEERSLREIEIQASTDNQRKKTNQKEPTEV